MERQSKKYSTPQQTQANKRPSPLPTPSATPNFLSPEGVLQLQRTIGNQAVQQLMNGRHDTGVSSLQRTDIPEDTSQSNSDKTEETGLADADIMNTYATAIHEYVTDPDNADKSIQQLTNLFTRELRQILSTLDIPMPKIEPDTLDGQYAKFTNTDWLITFDLEELGAAQTVGEISQDKLSNAVNTMYHEVRHAEQFFRVARMLAGEQLPQNSEAPAIKQLAKAIAKQMGIPQLIARKAVQQPLYESIGDPAFEEAKMWYRIMYGEDRFYRKLIQNARYEILPTVSKESLLLVDAIKKSVPPDYETLPDADKRAIDQKVQPDLDALQSYLDTLRQLQKPTEEQKERISNIPPADQTGYDAVMLITLDNILAFLTAIANLKPASISKLDEIKPLVRDGLFKEVEQAIKDFPTESDAYEVGDAVQKVFENIGSTSESAN